MLIAGALAISMFAVPAFADEAVSGVSLSVYGYQQTSGSNGQTASDGQTDVAKDDIADEIITNEPSKADSSNFNQSTGDVKTNAMSTSNAADSALTSEAPAPRACGWVDAGGSRYYYGDEGRALTGSQYIDGCWYRFDPVDGHMLTGWQVIDGKRYYYGDDGALYFKNHCIDGDWYWFDINEGWMWTGSANIYGGWYRYDLEDGRMLFGSQCIDGDWYRYDLGCGKMLFGSQCIDGEWYRYDLGCGKMLFGPQYIDGNWYWYDLGCGKMLFGWQNIYGHTYFYDRSAGMMYFGKHLIDGQKVRFHARQGYQVPYFRLYLDAGHGWNSSVFGEWDTGAGSFGFSEAQLTASLVNDVAQVVRDRYGIEVVTHTDQSSVHYRKRQSQAVDEGCSTLVSIHFNACGGSGFESYSHLYNSPQGSAVVQGVMHNALGQGIGIADRGMKKAELAVVGGYLPSTLLEVCFVDNISDMMIYQQRRALLVNSLAEGIYKLSLSDEAVGSGF